MDFGLLQGLRNGLLITEAAQSLVCDHQHIFVAAFLANLAHLFACAVAFHQLWLRQRDGVNHLAGQTVNLFSDMIGFHDLIFSGAKIQLLFELFSYLKKISDLCSLKNQKRICN